MPRCLHLPALLLTAALLITAPANVAAQSGGGGISLAGIGHDKGAEGAKVLVVEFGDFGCSYCAKFNTETYPQIDSAYIKTGRVRWKFVAFVTGNFRNSREVAEGAECAAEQNAFWKMHDILYARRKEWMASDQPRVTLLKYAKELHLDLARFTQCANNTATKLRIMHNDLLSQTLAIRGTPTFYVNGRVVPGAIPFDLFKQLIEGK